jgi:hypothetical protein
VQYRLLLVEILLQVWLINREDELSSDTQQMSCIVLDHLEYVHFTIAFVHSLETALMPRLTVLTATGCRIFSVRSRSASILAIS